MLHAVIMAGGSGTRFWPLSRRSRPKQLLPLTGEQTLVQQTVSRCSPWIPPEQTWIVTNQLQQEETARQLPQVPSQNFLIEPCGRNTAPCIGLAAAAILKQDPDAVMLVLPSDHVVQPASAFQEAVLKSAALIERQPDAFVLFGVSPTYPATGFGYIQRGSKVPDSDFLAFHVESFREKPQPEVANEYVRDGRYYWNCGIFLWRAARILSAIREFEPDIHARLMRVSGTPGSKQWKQSLADEFPEMKSISIDYAVLERASGVFVVEAPFAWDDVGSWQAVPRHTAMDEQGNAARGDFCGVTTSGCVIHSQNGHLIATAGLKDCIVVHTPDATLVADKNDEDAIRKLVAELAEQGYDRFL